MPSSKKSNKVKQAAMAILAACSFAPGTRAAPISPPATALASEPAGAITGIHLPSLPGGQDEAASAFTSPHGQRKRSLSDITGPLLALLQPLLSGVNGGLQAESGQIGKGISQVGSALSSVTSGVGTIVANPAAGAGGTVETLPGAIYKTTRNLQKDTGAVGQVLDTLTGPASSSTLSLLSRGH